jgi:pyruvate formate lyase activating enzyme
LRLGGLLRTSFSDFPGRIAAVAFTRGCNLRCPYCHNPELIHAGGEDPVDEAELFDLLRRRRGKLDGVVFTGGEPTLQADLADVLSRVKDLGFETKLDTNGSRPEVLEALLAEELVDLVAMDVKAPLPRYEEVTGVSVDTAAIEQSIRLLIGSGIEHEFRTTVAEPLLAVADLLAIGEELRGARRYVLQPFVAGTTLDPGFVGTAPDLTQMCAALAERGFACAVR